MDELSYQHMTRLREVRSEVTRFLMVYEFALDEVNTKINVLKKEFQQIHEYSPIEHCSSRIKSPESILKKAAKKKLDFSLETLRESIKDIAGIRITCPFISDVYKIAEMMENQKDIELIERKDYIKNPKPNGYQSLHLIIKIPVFMSNRVEKVYVELQIRTIAMDFWASLEHKIFYKYDGAVPARIREELKAAADSAAEMDRKMEDLNEEVAGIKKENNQENPLIFDEMFNVSNAIIKSIIKE
jgi:putative GTP pyrophosphokinase